jgi:hypothetical protein
MQISHHVTSLRNLHVARETVLLPVIYREVRSQFLEYGRKVKLSLCFINSEPRHEDAGGREMWLDICTRWRSLVSRRAPAALLPGERAPTTHWIGG